MNRAEKNLLVLGKKTRLTWFVALSEVLDELDDLEERVGEGPAQKKLP